MNFLVIAEDFRKDQYILQPIIEAMLAAAGRPRAKVKVCRDPLLGGVEQALSEKRIKEVLDRHRGMVDLFLLCVDRDGDVHRKAKLDSLEKFSSQDLASDRMFLGENAWQEIEVWALAGLVLPSDWNWQEIRREIHPKETYFDKIAEQRGLLDEPGGGRKTLGIEASRRYPRIRQLCPEDVANLEARARSWVESRS
jgi:hypothetical protein